MSLSSRVWPGHVSLGSLSVFGCNVYPSEPLYLAVCFLCKVHRDRGCDRNAPVLRQEGGLLSFGFVRVPGTWCWLLDVPCSEFSRQVPIL